MPDLEPREPVGTYQVWHKEGDWYRNVMNIECGNMLAALVLPYVGKDDPHYQRITMLVDEPRTTTFGDVIVNPANVSFEIYKPDFGGVGWRKIDFGKEQFKAILAEQKTDYQAARLRDTGQDYEKFLKERTERALDRMQGKEGREL
jgi:hypothetical protein